MNGEMHQICVLVSAVRTALTTASPINAAIDDHVDAISFAFQADSYMAHTVDDWFSNCVSRGLADMRMLCPTRVRDRQILGFANNPERCSMAAFYSGRKAACWTAYWEFLLDRKKWKVFYTENAWEDAPGEKLIFEDNTEQFSAVLWEIATFADRSGFSGFGDIFRSALHVLEGWSRFRGLIPMAEKLFYPN